jgi:hypothetical protein
MSILSASYAMPGAKENASTAWVIADLMELPASSTPSQTHLPKRDRQTVLKLHSKKFSLGKLFRRNRGYLTLNVHNKFPFSPGIGIWDPIIAVHPIYHLIAFKNS